ncbi:nucleoside-diphosphate sugar epimerase [Leptospira ryugenii]|uniref:Nucleoside-diphosphate sugar epimerase n=1 Tax=Leptospira ryugenii TaxID=1917863 RepID=A0A2P2E1R3_9LEPT|nr:TIGR01777 family oxidoreductase [Leptospira ryugenii]GBF50804.1 nucleoside-diphosphate sugar epimerase [Leptospira ryugenii]
MKIGILGGTGLIGTEIIRTGSAKGNSFRLFSRRDTVPPALQGIANLDLVTCTIPSSQQLEGLDALINLVGEPIAGVRWTEERKELIRTSRVEFTRGLVARIKDCKNPPSILLQSSAVGYYGMNPFRHPAYSEEQPAGEDFLAKICVDWERETDALSDRGIRVIKLRTGIVLSLKGGALEKMLPPFQMGVGGMIASGEQGMSWIHISDFVAATFYLLQRKSASGAFNIVAPNPTSNAEFSKTLAEVLFRPSFFKIPAFAIQALYGEGAQVVTLGQYVVPSHLTKEGYEFQFQNLKQALQNLLGKS